MIEEDGERWTLGPEGDPVLAFKSKSEAIEIGHEPLRRHPSITLRVIEQRRPAE